jgi:hypothetical protein
MGITEQTCYRLEIDGLMIGCQGRTIPMDRGKIESIIRENGYDDFKWIAGKDVVVPNGRDSSVCMAVPAMVC